CYAIDHLYAPLFSGAMVCYSTPGDRFAHPSRQPYDRARTHCYVVLPPLGKIPSPPPFAKGGNGGISGYATERRGIVLPFDYFDVLTFDCYGTLIDWETGLWAALQPVLSQHKIVLTMDEALTLYGALEAEAERGPYRAYRMVLGAVLQGMGNRLGFVPTETEL